MIPLDYSLFVLAALGAFLAIDVWLRRPERGGKLPTWTWIFAVVVLISGWFLVEFVDSHERDRTRAMVAGFAPTYAQELTRMGHASLDLHTDPQNPAYLAMIDAEIRWLRVNPLVNDIYTFKKTPDGRIYLMVDSETDYDRDGRYEGERESRTPIGEEYKEADETLQKAFRGKPVFDTDVVTDRWGTWVSAFVPMFDDQGRVDAVLGVDYAASDWLSAIRIGRIVVISALFVLLGIFGASVSTIGYLRSHIRRRQKVEEELVKAKKAAEAASIEKGDFLANMSHEIRTPLNGVIGMIDLLRDTKLSPNQKEFLEALKESSLDLSTLLNDILDFSKIEAGKLSLESVTFPVRECIEGALKPLTYRAQSKGLTLTSHVDAEVPDFVSGDPGRFRQILSNLVGNAIKFTESGRVAVEIVQELEDQDSIRLRASVTDTGIGIPRHKLGSIFGAFTQADSSITRRYGGTGLGLAIVSRLVSIMCGRIWVESKEGHGSRFYVTLPFGRPSEGTLPVSISPPTCDTTARTRLNILLAEDTTVNQAVTTHILAKRGHRVTIAANGREALDLMEKNGFDLILMDVQMPEMDGLEATRRIRARERETKGHIPIIAMTAHALTGDREMTLDAGMDEYLTKPIDGQMLLALIDRIAGEKPSDETSSSDWGTNFFSDHFGEDREMLKKIVALFEEDRQRLQQQIHQAVASGDATALERAAHALKGSVGNFGFKEAYTGASQLEKMGRTGKMEGSDTVIAKLETSLNRLSEFLQHL